MAISKTIGLRAATGPVPAGRRVAELLLKILLGAGLFCVLTGFGFLERLLAPGAELWERWETHDSASSMKLDHSAWGRFLRLYVASDSAGVNRIPYGRVSAGQRKLLAGYIARMTATPISRFSRGEQLAYWINLYNALTVQLVLSHYPVASILDIGISPGLLAFGPWGKKLVAVEGEELSLNDIEHRILRPIWRDPRLHYALNCSAIGCPNLQAIPFTAENAGGLLDASARAYINGARGVLLEKEQIKVSKIYNWFSEDFGGGDAGVIAHLKRFANEPLLRILEQYSEVSGYYYDWALNDASSRDRASEER